MKINSKDMCLRKTAINGWSEKLIIEAFKSKNLVQSTSKNLHSTYKKQRL